MALQALLFDLDGTLVDSHDEICRALDRAFEDVDAPLAPERVRELCDGSSLEVIWQRAGVGDAHAVEPFRAAYRKHYGQRIGHASRVFPHVLPTLTALCAHTPRVRLAVVSNKAPSQATDLLKVMGLSGFFERAFGASGTGIAPKPDPALLLVAARELACAPAECAMIGDTALDVQAGKRAGMRTIAVSYGFEPRERLLVHEPDHLIDSLHELLSVLR